MRTEALAIAGLRTLVVAPAADPRLCVVVLHGHAMVPEDLEPFARSLGVAARFLFPEGPVVVPSGGRGWWEVDPVAKARALLAGPRDLHAERPPGAAAARARMLAFLAEVSRAWSGPIVLVGFSQGGMLACDLLLREDVRVEALALLSSSRITADEWAPLVERLRGVPVLVSHGSNDRDLAFAAGEALRDLLHAGGAEVTWAPHEHGHEIPLVVWRALRRLLTAVANS